MIESWKLVSYFIKVVWDWSDFAVNFEQYVMPEQKIRRAPHSTTGEPWPLPQYYVTKKDKVFKIDRASFRFDVSKFKCDIIRFDRFDTHIIFWSVSRLYICPFLMERINYFENGHLHIFFISLFCISRSSLLLPLLFHLFIKRDCHPNYEPA